MRCWCGYLSGARCRLFAYVHRDNFCVVNYIAGTGLTRPVSQQLAKQLLLLHLFNGLFSRTTWVSRYQKGKSSLDLNEARHDEVLGCSGISWTICKQSAPRSRQITTPTPHHSIFTRRMLILTPKQQCQSTEGRN